MGKNLNFEDSLEELEKLVSELESGKLGLDESLTKFEKGLSLYKSCRTSLEKAEKKISILTESLKEEPYQE